jgi:hypothetical protein
MSGEKRALDVLEAGNWIRRGAQNTGKRSSGNWDVSPEALSMAK